MARSSNPELGRFAVLHLLGYGSFLDRQYTVFGQTIEGQNVVDAIRVGDVMESVTIEPRAA